MLFDWTDEFDAWLTRLEHDSDVGDETAKELMQLLQFEMSVLRELTEPPETADETPWLKHVRQSRKYPVWRLSHPYTPGIALRIIVWFPEKYKAVITLFANNKAQMGDVFYDSVGSRADQSIENFLRQRKAEADEQD